MDDTKGVECVWTDPSDHPQCPHGPALLFRKYENNTYEQYYACSACRDRKLCRFYVKHGEELSKQQKIKWEKERKNLFSRYPHQKIFIQLNELLAQTPENRCYCRDCGKFVTRSEKEQHTEHDVIEGLTDYQLSHPSEILKPLDNVKKEAQYLFSKKCVQDICQILVKLGAKQILCIGAPRIHEHISEHYQDTMSSLLLDIDARFHYFFGPLNFCWYNLFNHHFFRQSSVNVFKDFMTQNNGKDTFLICDPPFGGRVEPMSWTLKKISDLHKKWNNIDNEEDCLKIMFVFPHFMGSIMKQKSNPPSIGGGLKDLNMSDYKVDYDNHPLFVTETKKNKLPSPVRIFTNIPLNLIELPEADGYKYCKRCKKWVAKENKHCKKCKGCTSKDGRTYRHCNACARCVKPTWKHCKVCQRCIPEKHTCGSKPKITGRCFKCNEQGHIEKDCTIGQENKSTKDEERKRRRIPINIDDDNKEVTAKKAKKEVKTKQKELKKKKR